MIEALEILTTASLWAAGLRIATPLIFGALGALICERSGVLNLGIEGIMTLGAMIAWLAAYQGADLWVALAAAAAAGADAVLLIVAALDDTELGALLKEATALGLAAMVEVHDGAELRRAVQAGATVIGVNNRNLRTLAVDVNVSRNLVVQMPPGTVAVAESGLRTSADLVDLGAAGYHAFLIGETLITTPEPGGCSPRAGIGITRPGKFGDAHRVRLVSGLKGPGKILKFKTGCEGI